MTPAVTPARITMALDVRELYGPEVDEACGAAEPDVDMWELGLASPTAQQLALLGELTGFQVGWFFRPVPPGPLLGPAWVCWRGRRGCEHVEPNYVDERGVLHYGGEPPRTLESVTTQAALALFTPTAPAPAPFLKTGRSPRRDAAKEHLRKVRRQPPEAVQPELPGSLAAGEREALRVRIAQARQAVRRPRV